MYEELLNKNKYILSKSFINVFDGITPSKNIHKMYKTILKKDTNDYEIIKTTGIMSKDDVLAVIIDLTERKDSGLLNNGYSNIIGYVEHDGSEWRARVYCYGGVWYCYANDDLGFDWIAEHSFWSRNVTNTLSNDDTLTSSTSDTLNLEQAIKICKDNGLKVIKTITQEIEM